MLWRTLLEFGKITLIIDVTWYRWTGSIVWFTEDEIKLVRVCEQSLERDILIQKKESFYPFRFVSVDAIITFADYITLSVSVSMAYYHWLAIFLAGFALFTLRVCSQGKLIELMSCMSCYLSIFWPSGHYDQIVHHKNIDICTYHPQYSMIYCVAL